MPLRCFRGCWLGFPSSSHSITIFNSRCSMLLLFTLCLALVNAMTPTRIAELRKETVEMFYHGFDNYMDIAFPEDELRPVSCTPLTRDAQNPRHFELNDALGNYSLTLIDSLSTLAILASAPPDKEETGATALEDFQHGVASLVLQYGDGTSGASGEGLRARGFDLDSKVQIFETVIRGVGGLLSAHEFAVGILPINGYKPQASRSKSRSSKTHVPEILWPNGFKYDGQLLRLALDLAERLLPAFYTATGMPYPRVNLRHGIPFYVNSPLHEGSDLGDFMERGVPEITETCSAGAGSLVLEFTTLSRLTGDPRFEQLAKRAFWAVWNRRSNIGLIGAGIDAENGQWIGSYAGIGAGTDSFFEYAFKTHVLLSGHGTPNVTTHRHQNHDSWLDPNTIYNELSAEENSPEAFLAVWHEAHTAIRRHLYSSTHHPHYVNVHLVTGSPQAFWIDSLGAYYPGLLTLAGEVEEAIETSLLYTALWTRYAALPERWSVRDGHIEGGLGWWPGRPEFIESNYHLYRATRDPWYLHVGEMVLEDIKRRCWATCGWSGLQDVRTGEKSDRMESFFLGETAKYLYLLFDPDHPMNDLDAAYVFTTEGHPLVLPRTDSGPPVASRGPIAKKAVQSNVALRDTCPVPPPPLPFTVSSTAARTDIFHASSLIGLHMIPNHHTTIDNENIKVNNHTYFPWTLPTSMMPVNGTCDRLPISTTFTIEFPNNNALSTQSVKNGFNIVFNIPQSLDRTIDGSILVKSLSGLKMGMIHESQSRSSGVNEKALESWRVGSIANIPLGRDEQVLIPRDVIGDLSDPSFSRIRNPVMLDIVIQLEQVHDQNQNISESVEEYFEEDQLYDDTPNIALEESISNAGLAEYRTLLNSLLQQVTSALRDPAATLLPQPQAPPAYTYVTLPAVLPTGKGAHLLINAPEAPDLLSAKTSSATLSFTSIFFADEACNGRLPDEAVKQHHVIIMKRGGCTFSEKLSNIPSYTPTSKGLKLVIVVSDDMDDIEPGEENMGGQGGSVNGERNLVRPLLDQPQLTPSGLLRHHQVSMVMIGGGDEAIEALMKAKSIGIRRRYHVESQGLLVSNIFVV
ncbi:hypothetical protein sscle_05g048390 [Sclerotinia sclerotiorum 1980 UF-70]|uniref:alpha-1,2-Mannosidase n=2 Tax=Sclerotinia sclerotiorum (strain ATCC 18683 / 1980 / Ss-1) TaxID=665079 RepID=A0A1D9Q5A6_SCLS1|nr:hypothetical protein sscle_05g048390 [Sclerotinia sclerotiorum 1980 UF-70]